MFLCHPLSSVLPVTSSIYLTTLSANTSSHPPILILYLFYYISHVHLPYIFLLGTSFFSCFFVNISYLSFTFSLFTSFFPFFFVNCSHFPLIFPHHHYFLLPILHSPMSILHSPFVTRNLPTAHIFRRHPFNFPCHSFIFHAPHLHLQCLPYSFRHLPSIFPCLSFIFPIFFLFLSTPPLSLSVPMLSIHL
jgi:hypothetical protein